MTTKLAGNKTQKEPEKAKAEATPAPAPADTSLQGQLDALQSRFDGLVEYLQKHGINAEPATNKK